MRCAKRFDERGCGCTLSDADGVYPNQSTARAWRRVRPEALPQALLHAASLAGKLGSAEQKRERDERRGALSSHAPHTLLQRTRSPAEQAVAHMERKPSDASGRQR